MANIGNVLNEKVLESKDIANGSISPPKLSLGAPSWDVSGNVTASGDISAFSDQNLKKDIFTYPNALDTILKLEGVTFRWKETDKKSAGVIAQKVQYYAEELVAQNLDENGNVILSVNYNGLIGILIEAVKDLNRQVEKLKNNVS